MPSTSSSAAERGGHAPSPDRCRHCATALRGRFCHACGEDAHPPQTSWESWRAQVVRVRRTLASLWFAPGRLACEHLHGVRVGTIPPVTLLLNAVAVFFLFSAATQFQLAGMEAAPWMRPAIEAEAAARGLAPDALLARAERRFQSIYTLSLALVSGVGYTLVYRLLFRRALPGWRGAATLALYYLAFLFTLFLPLMLLVPVRATASSATALAVLLAGIGIALAWNVAAARRIGRHGWAMALAKGLAVVVAGFIIDTVMTWIAVRVTLAVA
jgi:hypothetical protein